MRYFHGIFVAHKNMHKKACNYVVIAGQEPFLPGIFRKNKMPWRLQNSHVHRRFGRAKTTSHGTCEDMIFPAVLDTYDSEMSVRRGLIRYREPNAAAARARHCYAGARPSRDGAPWRRMSGSGSRSREPPCGPGQVLPYEAPSAQSSTPFWACSRFSASSKTTLCGPSITSSVISSPRWAGRQCITSASGAAPFSNRAFNW